VFLEWILLKEIRIQTESGYIRTGERLDDRIKAGGREYSFDEVDVLAPCSPSKIICVGVNYHGHIKETDSEIPERPVLFLKTPNTVASHGDVISLPDPDKRFDYEAELGVVIGRQARSVSASEAMDYVKGFTCLNDLSNRNDQEKEQNWVRGKAFDSAAPIGPVVASPEHVPGDAAVRCRVNGEIRQDASRDDLIFSVKEIIEEITKYVTLEPGDVIATGTPQGIAPLEEGDTVEIEVEGVGTLRNTVTFRT